MSRRIDRTALADKLTNVLLSEMFGKEYDEIDDLEENEYLSEQWDYFNDQFYSMLMVFFGDEEYLITFERGHELDSM